VFHFGGEHPSNIMYHTPRAHKKTDQDQEHQNTLSYVGFGMLFYYRQPKGNDRVAAATAGGVESQQWQ